MGVKGAALATIISQGVSAIMVLGFLFSKKSKLRINKESIIPNVKVILSCMALGLAPFIMQSTESILNICFNTSLKNYGGDTAVGAMTICTSLMIKIRNSSDNSLSLVYRINQRVDSRTSVIKISGIHRIQ